MFSVVEFCWTQVQRTEKVLKGFIYNQQTRRQRWRAWRAWPGGGKARLQTRRWDCRLTKQVGRKQLEIQERNMPPRHTRCWCCIHFIPSQLMGTEMLLFVSSHPVDKVVLTFLELKLWICVIHNYPFKVVFTLRWDFPPQLSDISSDVSPTLFKDRKPNETHC